MKPKKQIHTNYEHIERSMMRPMAEELAEKIAVRRGCVDYYIDKVELGTDGKCDAHAVFIYKDREEKETITLYYTNEL